MIVKPDSDNTFVHPITGDAHHDRLRDEDDALLQFAIQQSLVEAGTEGDQVRLLHLLL